MMAHFRSSDDTGTSVELSRIIDWLISEAREDLTDATNHRLKRFKDFYEGEIHALTTLREIIYPKPRKEDNHKMSHSAGSGASTKP